MAEFFESPRIYIQSATVIKDKVERIDALILATMDAMVTAATNDDVAEYTLNDGQTIIKVGRRSVEQMASSIKKLETLKNMYVQDFEGHSYRLVDHESTRLLTGC